MQNLAHAIKLAAKLREDSYDKASDHHSLSIYDACDKATEIIESDSYVIVDTFLLYILLVNSWTAALYWAEITIAMGEKE